MGIMGMTQLLKNTKLAPEEKKLVETIHQSSEVLLVILIDILDLSKIESGMLELKHTDFDIVETITETVKLLEAQASLNQLTIHKQFLNTTPRKILGYPGRIRQILTNLIGNAIKFSEKGGITVCLNTDLVSKNSALVLIQVIDEGISVPKDELELIFEAFAQADVSTTRQFSGTGLGLTISRQLVEMMGGKIGVENNSGPGSTFWFEISFDVSPVFSAPDGEQVDLGARFMHSELLNDVRILVAEDNVVNQFVIRKILEELGCEVTIVNDGIEVVRSWKARRYDMILMDIQMPNRDGIAATRVIRKLENGEQSVPIIAITANALKNDRDACIEAGLDDYLSKPYRIEEFKLMLERWIKLSRAPVDSRLT